MKDFTKYFGLSTAVTLACLFGGWYIGGLAGFISVLVLSFLEVSLSLDNAVVNAKVLKDMNAFWRKMFLTVGMLIAVFAMRGFFPLAIVSMTTELSIIGAGSLALSDPKTYSETLLAAHPMIAGFGGAFLMLVFLDFFVDPEKDKHWIGFIEKPLAKLGEVGSITILITGAALYGIKTMLPVEEGNAFFMAGIAGVGTYIIVGSLESVIGWFTAGSVAKAGLAGFLYLEVLDASFSFDGVIGAFAITTDVIVIMLGLTVGAMFVRSLTIVAVDKDTLEEFEFLEHGAFWAIGSLAVIMGLGLLMHIPEVVSGLIGAAILAISVIHSKFHTSEEEAADAGIILEPGTPENTTLAS